MCFSPEADLVTGLAVGVVGVDALRHTREPRELPLASLPLLFAAHQLIETFVWWGLDGSVAWSVGRAAMWAYLVIAFVLPVIVPLCVVAVEPVPRRREAMTLCVGLGAAVSAVLLFALAQGPVTATRAAHQVSYHYSTGSDTVIVVLYVIATCGSLLASSSRPIVWFGVANLVAVSALAALTTGGVASLWCGWAAISSVAIARHLRAGHGPLEVVSPRPGQSAGTPR